MKYVFISNENVVVNVISGTLSADQQQKFLADYSVMYGAAAVFEADDELRVWIGGVKNGDEYMPPEPEPIAADTIEP